MWCKFETLEAFNLWHTQIKNELGIPLPDGITTAYTEPHLVEDGTYSAWVDDEYADKLLQGLTPTPKKIWK